MSLFAVLQFLSFFKLTLAFLLTHNGVTEGEQAEKLMSARVSHFHWFQQLVIIEAEVWVRQRVEGTEVQPLKTNEW